MEISQAIWNSQSAAINRVLTKEKEIEDGNRDRTGYQDMLKSMNYKYHVAEPKLLKSIRHRVGVPKVIIACYMLCLSPNQVSYKDITIQKHCIKEGHTFHYWFSFMRHKEPVMIPILDEWDYHMLHNICNLSIDPEQSDTFHLQAPPRSVFRKLDEQVPKLYATLGLTPWQGKNITGLWQLRYKQIASYGIDTQAITAYVNPYKRKDRGSGLLDIYSLENYRIKMIKTFNYQTI